MRTEGEKGRQCPVIHVLGEGSENGTRKTFGGKLPISDSLPCDWQQRGLVNRETADSIQDNINNQLVILSHWFYFVGI